MFAQNDSSHVTLYVPEAPGVVVANKTEGGLDLGIACGRVVGIREQDRDGNGAECFLVCQTVGEAPQPADEG